MLGQVIRDINLLGDEWTIFAKWPWTARSAACVARTAADARAARARDLQPLIAVGVARALVGGMDRQAWTNQVISFAEHDPFSSAA